MAAESHLITASRLRRALAGFLLVGGFALPVSAQDPPPPPPDSLVTTLPDSVREVFGRPPRTEPQAFPERRHQLRGAATEVFECDRDCIQASAAFSLIDLLTDRIPGITPVRGGYSAGPHHVFEGAYGAGFVALYIDGREVPSLERAQTDLRRLSLVTVASVRVFREPAGLVIDVETYRHAGEAYSRIGGGTGDPRLQTLEGAFANGIGDAFVMNGGFELLDSEPGGVENDRFEAAASLSWMPRSNDFGVQFEYRTETVERFAADTAEVRRNSLMLRARANIGERTQVELYGSASSWKLKAGGTGLVLPEPPEETEQEAEARLNRDADVLGVRVSTALAAGSASLGSRLGGGGAYASSSSDLSITYPLGPLWLEGGYDRGSWTGFAASSWRAGAAFSDTLLVPFTLRGFASSGDRGIGDPVLDTAHVVGYSASGVAGELGLGPFRVSGRYAGQRLDRQVALAASWDRVTVLDSAAVDVTTWEARVEGPLIPIGGLIKGLEPIRIRGFYRRNSTGETLPLYVPDNLFRAELSLHDSFFEDNLNLWLSAYLERKGQRLIPRAGEPEPALASSYTWSGFQLMFKIGDFRFYYRSINPTALSIADIAGADFPRTISLVGIRWEFFN